jgi:hypothetical protein
MREKKLVAVEQKRHRLRLDLHPAEVFADTEISFGVVEPDKFHPDEKNIGE